MRETLRKARKEKGLTQQQVADQLRVGLRHYQKIEAGDTTGSFEIWDALEDILGIHQRILRETTDNRHVPKENQQEH
ncbi:helix-turn-helix transcriptional regulator [Lachnospiraceae bacterium MD335]|nr:helix-turn-helix transcriptional regulator [Lachnospiraceae bacterium MD335]